MQHSMNAPGDACIRGCMSLHYASCPDFGTDLRPVEDGSTADRCTGCAPSPTVHGTLVCARCYRRLRGMLFNAHDLLGRMRSLASQGKAVVYSSNSGGARGSAPVDPIYAELFDALVTIEANLRQWWQHFDARTLRGLDTTLTYPHHVEALWEAVIELHPADAEGDRHAWSLADAAARWGIERRDRFVYDGADEDGIEVERTSVPEWYDRLLTTKQAADRIGKTQRVIQKWIADGDLAVAVKVRMPDGTMIRSVYASAVDALARTKKPGRPRKELVATPAEITR